MDVEKDRQAAGGTSKSYFHSHDQGNDSRDMRRARSIYRRLSNSVEQHIQAHPRRDEHTEPCREILISVIEKPGRIGSRETNTRT
jgi:hypothetical protein